VALAPSDIPRLEQVQLDAQMVVITMLISAFTVLLFGLAPVLQAFGRDFTMALKESGKSSSGVASNRLRGALVIAEVAIALVLLVGAGLLLRSFLHLRNTDLGFDPKNVLTFRVTLPQTKYETPPKWSGFFQEAVQKAATLPGVESAAVVLMRPLSGPIGWDYDFTVEGQTQQEQQKNPFSNHQRVSPGYFGTMGIKLKAGRDFTWADSHDGQKVLIVNQSTAERFWRNQDPIGKRLRFGPYNVPPRPDGHGPSWFTVVGVVADAKYRDLGPSRPDLYVPFLQVPNFAMDFVIKTKVPPLTLANAATKLIQEIDPGQAVADITTMDKAMSVTIARPRLRSALLGTFAGLALILAAVGLYGIISYSVTQRRRELGIRTALGADRPDLLRLILRFGLGLTGIGLVLGLFVAIVLAGTGWVDELLFGVKASDVATFAAVPLILLAVAGLASVIPARRATRIDPLIALRVE
jgi:putative ABC transport system permease protein